MSIKTKLLIGVLVGNYLLTLYTFIVYGVYTNNLLFSVCGNSITVFTIVSVIVYLIIKNLDLIKIMIK